MAYGARKNSITRSCCRAVRPPFISRAMVRVVAPLLPYYSYFPALVSIVRFQGSLLLFIFHLHTFFNLLLLSFHSPSFTSSPPLPIHLCIPMNKRKCTPSSLWNLPSSEAHLLASTTTHLSTPGPLALHVVRLRNHR